MRQLTIVNQTSDIIVWDSENKGRSQSRILLPSLSCKITVSAIQSEITLSCLSNRGDAEKDWTAHPNAYKFRLPMSLGAMWKVVNMPEGCPWWIYRGKVRVLVSHQCHFTEGSVALPEASLTVDPAPPGSCFFPLRLPGFVAAVLAAITWYANMSSPPFHLRS